MKRKLQELLFAVNQMRKISLIHPFSRLVILFRVTGEFEPIPDGPHLGLVASQFQGHSPKLEEFRGGDKSPCFIRRKPFQNVTNIRILQAGKEHSLYPELCGEPLPVTNTLIVRNRSQTSGIMAKIPCQTTGGAYWKCSLMV